MKKTQTVKRKNRKPLQRGKRLLLFMTACFLLGTVGSWAWELWTMSDRTDEQLKKLSESKAMLLETQENLKEEKERLNTPSYIEQLAREQLGLVRPGEILIAPKEETK